MIAPDQDLFGNPEAAAGASPSGSARRSARASGCGASSAAEPILTLPPLRGHSCDPATLSLSKGPAALPAPPPCPVSNTAAAGPFSIEPSGHFVPVAAMEAMLALRVKQIHDHGHTTAADLNLIDRTGHRHAIAKLAQQCLHDAITDMILNKSADQIRRRLVKAGALTMAAIDAEDARHG